MEHIVQMGLLYDFYGGLLTKKQQKVFSLYFLDNLSLAEIAEQEGTTRQAVHDLLQRTEKLLFHWEAVLKLLDRYHAEKQAVLDIRDSISNLQKIIPKHADTDNEFKKLKTKVKVLEDILEL